MVAQLDSSLYKSGAKSVPAISQWFSCHKSVCFLIAVIIVAKDKLKGSLLDFFNVTGLVFGEPRMEYLASHFTNTTYFFEVKLNDDIRVNVEDSHPSSILPLFPLPLKTCYS